MELSLENHSHIAKAIDAVYERWCNARGMILTESDLKCQLFAELSKSEVFCQYERTYNSTLLASPLHTEISWYDDNDNLGVFPDITLVSPKNLSLTDAAFGAKLPSKGFAFTGASIMLELKFIRDADRFPREKLDEIQDDLKKIGCLFERLRREGTNGNPDAFCYFVIFARSPCCVTELRTRWDRYVGGNANDWRLLFYCFDSEKNFVLPC